jgi:hypothetical protein
MKIFIDVGGHVGETVEAVLDPGYGFERIYSFEPVRSCAEAIRAINDRRLVVIEAGLSNSDCEAMIFGAGQCWGVNISRSSACNGLCGKMPLSRCHQIVPGKPFDR